MCWVNTIKKEQERKNYCQEKLLKKQEGIQPIKHMQSNYCGVQTQTPSYMDSEYNNNNNIIYFTFLSVLDLDILKKVIVSSK